MFINPDWIMLTLEDDGVYWPGLDEDVYVTLLIVDDILTNDVGVCTVTKSFNKPPVFYLFFSFYSL